LVKRIKDNVKKFFETNEHYASNLQRMIQKEVVNELTAILEVDRKPFSPKKGKANVIMFVGLQGSGKTTSCTKYAYYW
jgi:signal recognition particle subunit SRP54